MTTRTIDRTDALDDASWRVWVILGALVLGVALWIHRGRAAPAAAAGVGPALSRQEAIVDRNTSPGEAIPRLMCEYGPDFVLVVPATGRCPAVLQGIAAR